MTKAQRAIAAGAVLLWAGAALGAPTPQQSCDEARVKAWKKYQACVDQIIAKDAKGTSFDWFAASWKCRRKYFGNWTKFQTKGSVQGSTCVGPRFTDNGDQTVTDKLSGLTWEKKSNLDFVPNPADPHDAENLYSWSAGAPYKEDGTAFRVFLATLNSLAFGGANGWRLPTLAELLTIVLDFDCSGSPCTCPSTTCVDPALDAGNTAGIFFWSATGYVPDAGFAWPVHFGSGGLTNTLGKPVLAAVRAVRGGL